MPPKGQKRLNIVGALREYFYRHPNVRVNIYQLEDALGFDRRQIQQSIINSLKTFPGWLDIIQRGQAWVYCPDKIPTDTEEVTADEWPENPEEAEENEADDKGFYQVSTSEDGRPILQKDTDGTFWIATRV